MTQIGSVYAQALYSLAKEENQSLTVLNQLMALNQSFSQEPDYLRLLAAPNLSKQERCRIVDDSFRGNVHPYVLNFMKILTEKGYMRHFGDCCKAYRQIFNREHGILEVCAVTAVPLNAQQTAKLTQKLSQETHTFRQLVGEGHVDDTAVHAPPVITGFGIVFAVFPSAV